MSRKAIAAGAALGAGVLMLLSVIGIQTLAKGNEDFRISATTLTAYVGTDTYVSIPDTVTVIGEGAFAGNTTLQKLSLPDSIQEIGYNAFGDCTALTAVTLPDSVRKVGPGAFKGCTALTTVELGSGITSWGSGVFNECTSLSTLLVADENPFLLQYNGVLFNGDMSMLYQVLAARTGENYVMPDEVGEIDTYAFWNLQNTKNVKVSSGVTTIPSYAMSSMGNVENVILPQSVTRIAAKAFANNSNLKQIMIPASVTEIAETAFDNSPNVKILTTKDSTADKYGQEHKLTVIYEAEYPTDFNDSNADSLDKPQKKQRSTTSTVSTTTTETTGEETQEESEQETSTEADITAQENPLDTVESGVIGKTRIVNRKAVVLIGKLKQKVYGNAANSDSE